MGCGSAGRGRAGPVLGPRYRTIPDQKRRPTRDGGCDGQTTYKENFDHLAQPRWRPPHSRRPPRPQALPDAERSGHEERIQPRAIEAGFRSISAVPVRLGGDACPCISYGGRAHSAWGGAATGDRSAGLMWRVASSPAFLSTSINSGSSRSTQSALDGRPRDRNVATSAALLMYTSHHLRLLRGRRWSGSGDLPDGFDASWSAVEGSARRVCQRHAAVPGSVGHLDGTPSRVADARS